MDGWFDEGYQVPTLDALFSRNTTLNQKSNEIGNRWVDVVTELPGI